MPVEIKLLQKQQQAILREFKLLKIIIMTNQQVLNGLIKHGNCSTPLYHATIEKLRRASDLIDKYCNNINKLCNSVDINIESLPLPLPNSETKPTTALRKHLRIAE